MISQGPIEDRLAIRELVESYNDAVMRLNEGIVVFPASIVAGWFGIEQMGMFEAAAPKVAASAAPAAA